MPTSSISVLCEAETVMNLTVPYGGAYFGPPLDLDRPVLVSIYLDAALAAMFQLKRERWTLVGAQDDMLVLSKEDVNEIVVLPRSEVKMIRFYWQEKTQE